VLFKRFIPSKAQHDKKSSFKIQETSNTDDTLQGVRVEMRRMPVDGLNSHGMQSRDGRKR
jgi:hypothetical protein